MTRRPDRVRQHQQRIVIAVWRNAHDLKKVAGGFAFGPETLFGAREKGDVAFRQRFFQRRLIHITVHQHFAGDVVLHDTGHHARGFDPVQAGQLVCC